MRRAIAYAVIITAAGGANAPLVFQPKGNVPLPPSQLDNRPFDGSSVRDYSPGYYRGQDGPKELPLRPAPSFDRNTGSPYGNGLGRR